LKEYTSKGRGQGEETGKRREENGLRKGRKGSRIPHFFNPMGPSPKHFFWLRQCTEKNKIKTTYTQSWRITTTTTTNTQAA